MKIVLFCCLLFSMNPLISDGQTRRLGDSLKITFRGPVSKVSQHGQLTMTVNYENTADRSIKVYSQLQAGYLHDRFCNLNISIEKQAEGKYSTQEGIFYKQDSKIYFSDSLRHYDPPKKLLAPKHYDTLQFDLTQGKLTFPPGNYRVKIMLRVNTILNNSAYTPDPSGTTAPPEDDLVYISSDWMYFKVDETVSP